MVSEKYRSVKNESWLIFSAAYLPQDNASIFQNTGIVQSLGICAEKRGNKYPPKDIIEISKSIHKMKINEKWKLSETPD